MSKEMYKYNAIEAKLAQERATEEQARKKLSDQAEMSFDPRNSTTSDSQGLLGKKGKIDKKRTGDPFKDFALDMSRIQSPEAIKYINIGREHLYD